MLNSRACLSVSALVFALAVAPRAALAQAVDGMTPVPAPGQPLADPGAFVPAGPSEADLYAVPNVRVDETAGSAAAARDRAIVAGQRVALRHLLERLSQDAPPPLDLSDEQIGMMLLGFEVQEERASPVRYVATLTYRFDPESVRRMLGLSGGDYVVQASSGTAILPVFSSGGQARLWDDPNPWRFAWQSAPPRSALAPIVAPYGEIEDVMAVSAEQALAADPEALARYATRYGVDEVLIASVAEPVPSQTLDVTLVRAVPYGRVETAHVAVPPAESADAQMRDAVAAVTAWLESSWKASNGALTGGEARLALTAEFGGLDEWLEIRRRLSQTPGVVDVDVLGLTQGAARLEVAYRGPEDRLAAALAQRDLAVDVASGDATRRLTIGTGAPRF